MFHMIPEDQKIHIAIFYMTGTALQWYHWPTSTNQLTTWEALARQAELRFGPSSFVNHEARLFKLRQRTTFEAYMSEFESLSTRIPPVSSSSLLNCFLSGLRNDIQCELYMWKQQTL